MGTVRVFARNTRKLMEIFRNDRGGEVEKEIRIGRDSAKYPDWGRKRWGEKEIEIGETSGGRGKTYVAISNDGNSKKWIADSVAGRDGGDGKRWGEMGGDGMISK